MDETHVIVLEGDSVLVSMRMPEEVKTRCLELRYVSVERIQPNGNMVLRMAGRPARDNDATSFDMCMQMLSDAVCDYRR